MKRKFAIKVRGADATYSFNFIGDDEHWQDWLDQGLEVDMVVNTVSPLVQRLGLTSLVCYLQDKGWMKY